MVYIRLTQQLECLIHLEKKKNYIMLDSPLTSPWNHVIFPHEPY